MNWPLVSTTYENIPVVSVSCQNVTITEISLKIIYLAKDPALYFNHETFLTSRPNSDRSKFETNHKPNNCKRSA